MERRVAPSGVRREEAHACRCELGVIQSRRAEAEARADLGGKGDWCVLKTVGDINHEQVWVEADRGCWKGSRLRWRHNDGSPLGRSQ